MSKKCIEPGCLSNQFGGGFCKYHQYRRRMHGGDEHKRKAPIKKRTPKREKDERYYAVQAKEFFDEAVINKTNRCFFCGEWVLSFQGLHHLKGRTNEYLLDKEWWVIVHNKCHTEDYHQSNAEQRRKQSWWNDFLQRIKAKGEDLYRKELNKLDKANPINPQRGLFDDED